MLIPVIEQVLSMNYFICCLVLFIVLIPGCQPLGTDYTFRRDGEITSSFEESIILPGYNYFFYGPEAEPLAVLGVRKEINFMPGLWKKVELTEKKLTDWVEIIDNRHRGVYGVYHGSRIIDKNGKEIGVWYSLFDRTTVRTNPDGGSISIYTPDDSRINRLLPRRSGDIK